MNVKNIEKQLSFIADIELQKLSWFGKHQNMVSSFDETIEMLYDFGFSDFLNQEKLNYKLHKNLIILNDLIENYDRKEKDEDIINDSEWLNIVNQAKKCINLWNLN